MGPLSEARAGRIAVRLAAAGPGTVVDFGCGWGELLLRILAATPGATGVGVDVHGPDLVRGRANAERAGLAERVTFVEGEAGTLRRTADVILSLGAYHAFGSVRDALVAFREMVAPGGRVLFGAEFWEREPSAERLARMWPGASAGDCTDLAGLVDKAIDAGFRPLWIETVSRDEWDEFESGLASDVEEWLLAHPDHLEAQAVREKLDDQRSMWLRGHRDVMGFAYLTLGAG